MAGIGIGIIGGGYMGKAHSVAMSAVGAVFDTALRPRLEMIAARTPDSAERYRAAFGFARAAFARGKPVFCEKPLGASLDDARAMTAVAEASGLPNMVGFNYVRTPATQFARQLVAAGEIGRVTWFRGEHTEDFDADPDTPATWRSQGLANGTMGDLAPHMINAALALAGPISTLTAEIETVHATRGGAPVTNDDQAQIMCRFASGAMGHLYFSRTAHGRKMGYAYEITGTRGAIRFDQEDQNALWLYRSGGPEAEAGFRKILTGPAHPDYEPFCLGPGHGTGYQDQIIIEARDFLSAIETGRPVWPTFRDGLAVAEVVAAARAAHAARGWVEVAAA